MQTPTLPDTVKPADTVKHRLEAVAQRLQQPDFEPVRPGRWRHLPSGLQVETNYTYGEGRVRVYEGGNRTPVYQLMVLGQRLDELEKFYDLFSF